MHACPCPEVGSCACATAWPLPRETLNEGETSCRQRPSSVGRRPSIHSPSGLATLARPERFDHHAAMAEKTRQVPTGRKGVLRRALAHWPAYQAPKSLPQSHQPSRFPGLPRNHRFSAAKTAPPESRLGLCGELPKNPQWKGAVRSRDVVPEGHAVAGFLGARPLVRMLGRPSITSSRHLILATLRRVR